MKKAIVKIAFRQIIDANASGTFERDVWRDSYQEYLVQVQSFDRERQYPTWDALRTAIPKANVNVQYKTAFAIGLYVQGLQNKIPGAITASGQSISFENYQFEILASDVRNPNIHAVSITYTTPPLELLDAFGAWLLLRRETEVFMAEIQPGLSIVHYEAA
ncbi:hypothetical protein [Chitinophaga cymbidii]|uniref:Uncharacterized protein n=1 Tax=Chitinophaga cymbidii TaxID=1096750 RepID=A0A512RQK4_9BACT|nr:hypothetical protein [Chitinophaga cymbidii]GEP97969.1 hypothetical protein CCY01nite_42290 [Chitinophaga cymbidii]